MTDAQRLRERLLLECGTDWGLSDERLMFEAERARAKVRGRRWSWIALAIDAIRRQASTP